MDLGEIFGMDNRSLRDEVAAVIFTRRASPTSASWRCVERRRPGRQHVTVVFNNNGGRTVATTRAAIARHSPPSRRLFRVPFLVTRSPEPVVCPWQRPRSSRRNAIAHGTLHRTGRRPFSVSSLPLALIRIKTPQTYSVDAVFLRQHFVAINRVDCGPGRHLCQVVASNSA